MDDLFCVKCKDYCLLEDILLDCYCDPYIDGAIYVYRCTECKSIIKTMVERV